MSMYALLRMHTTASLVPRPSLFLFFGLHYTQKRKSSEKRGATKHFSEYLALMFRPALKSGFSSMMCSNEVMASAYWPILTNTVPIFCRIFSLKERGEADCVSVARRGGEEKEEGNDEMED